jgi:hypothetical protein
MAAIFLVLAAPAPVLAILLVRAAPAPVLAILLARARAMEELLRAWMMTLESLTLFLLSTKVMSPIVLVCQAQ